MKKILLFNFVCVCISASLFAQDPTIKDLKNEAAKVVAKDPKDTATKVWKLGGLFNLNINQGSLSNWSAGGDKFSFSLNAYLNV